MKNYLPRGADAIRHGAAYSRATRQKKTRVALLNDR